MPLTHTIDSSELIDLLPDVVCAVGPDGTFIYISAACEKVFGYQRDEMQGRLMLDFVHPEDQQRTLDMAREVVAGKPLPYFENRYLRKDGSVAHIMWSARWSDRNQLRIAVARDLTERRRSEAVQATLYRISEAVHRAGDLDALYKEIHSSIGTLLPARNFLVALYDPLTQMLSFPYFVDEYDSPPAPLPLTSDSLCGEVVRSGKPLRITPADQPALASRLQHFPGKDVVDWLGVPLRTEAGVLGALVVQSYAGGQRYSQQDLELLHFVSNQVAAAIERKRLYEQQEFFALHDPLTGLPNRRLFQDRLQGALQRARRNGSRFALLFLDLNGFKRINDALGHEAGDQLLQQVGLRLQQRVRGSDTVARVGGDEFVLLLESIGEGDVSGFLQEKILEAFTRHFELGVSVVDIHPSIGVAVFPDDGTDERSLLDQADRRMYDSKKARPT